MNFRPKFDPRPGRRSATFFLCCPPTRVSLLNRRATRYVQCGAASADGKIVGTDQAPCDHRRPDALPFVASGELESTADVLARGAVVGPGASATTTASGTISRRANAINLGRGACDQRVNARATVRAGVLSYRRARGTARGFARYKTRSTASVGPSRRVWRSRGGREGQLAAVNRN